jgi:outer membrane protein, heavy metal efflux system
MYIASPHTWLVALVVLSLSPVAPDSIGWLGAQEPGHEPSAPTAPSMLANSAASSGQLLDSLIARALAVSPRLRAATSRVTAAGARVGPAAALPDPMLMAGIVNQPLGNSASPAMANTDGPDPMTMRMIGIEQTIPFPGKRSLRRQTAERERDAARFALEDARRQVHLDVEAAYFELAYVDHALQLVRHNGDVLATLITVTESRYTTGLAGQQDVLKARVEATRLAESASELNEQRVALVAQINALLTRPSDAALPSATVPEAITLRAVPPSASAIRFASSSLGSRSADSPLKPLAALQDAAVRGSTELREHEAMIAAQRARLSLARKEQLPDVQLSLQYGQRSGGLPDMLTATLAVPLPVFKARKQDQLVAEQAAELAAQEAEHHQQVNALRADVARMVADAERARTRLALAVKVTLPQSRAALASATASYQSGKAEFLSVIDAQATVFTLESDYYRALSDFAKNVAELRRVAGEEVLQ